MAQIIDNKTSTDRTIQIFDSFYSFNTIVNANEYDIVHSYFISKCDTVKIADNFTAALFRIAQESGDNALDILQQFYGQTGPQLTLSLCYYLNSTRSNATLLGLLQPTAPNYWTARNVRQ